MFDRILNFIIQNRFVLFIPVLIIVIFLFLSITLKRKKISFVSFLLTFLANGMYLIYGFLFRDKSFFNIPFEYFVGGITLVALLYNSIEFLVSYFKLEQKIKIIQTIPSNIESNIYAYMNNKSKIILFTDQFYNMFMKLVTKKKLWYDAISNIEFDSKNLNVKEFLLLLKISEEKLFKFNIHLKNSEIIKIELLKKKIIKNGKLLGYIIINQKLTLPEIYKDSIQKEFKKRLYIYYDLLDEQIAYYENHKKKYLLTSSMIKLLGLKDVEINSELFEKLILKEDLKIFQNRIVDEHVNKIHFRMNTINGIEWFEESTLKHEDTQFIVIRRSDFHRNKVSFKGYNELLADLRSLIKKDSDFALGIISFDDIPKINDTIGKDASELVVVKYFKKLSETELGKYRIYKFGKLEYALLFDNLDIYETILRDLKNNVSELLGLEIYFNELKFDLRNSIGIVSSKLCEEYNAEAILKAGFDALLLASDNKYAKNYSIYYPKKSVSLYKADEEDIDLSDSFLEKLLNK